MRTVFKHGYTLPLAKRKQQLLQLERLVEENADAICEALHKDLGRPRMESVRHDLKHAQCPLAPCEAPVQRGTVNELDAN